MQSQTKTILFKEGLPGFEHLKEFILLEEEVPFCCLQALEDKGIAFVMIDPFLLNKKYTPHIQEHYFENLGGGENKDFAIYVIVTVAQEIVNTTINLQGPLLIHIEKRLGVQVIVEDKHYTTKHNLLEFAKEGNITLC